jgi:titin
MLTTTGANMFDISGFNAMPFAYGSSPVAPALLPTAGGGNYSQVAIKASYRSMFFLLGSYIPLQFNRITSCYSDLILIKYNLATIYPNITPFQFMTSSKKLCSCGAGCTCNNTSITVPSAATNLVAIPGNTTALIYFTISDGNSPIINFAYSLNGGTSFIPFSPGQSASPLTISGLTNGTTYIVQIKATNGIGTGAASSTVTVTPGLPAPPTNVTVQPGSGNALIYFTPGANNGSAITNYKYSINGGAFTLFSPAQTTSPITIGTLTNGTAYSIQIAPVNSVGTGPASSTVTTIVGTPTSPTNLVGVPSATSVSITFTGSSDNGSAIITYAYSINGGMSFIPTHPNTTTSPVIIAGLTPGTSYNIQLAATNAYGLGAPSASLIIGT